MNDYTQLAEDIFNGKYSVFDDAADWAWNDLIRMKGSRELMVLLHKNSLATYILLVGAHLGMP